MCRTRYKNRICTIAIILLICEHFQGVHGKKNIKYALYYSSGMSICNDEDSRNFMDTSKLQAISINETMAKVEGEFEVKKTMDKLIKAKATIEKVLPSGKEIIFTHEIPDFCYTIKNKDNDQMHGSYMKTVSFPPECPITPGTYKIVNMIADTKQLPINAITEGMYTVTTTFYQYEKKGSGLFAQTEETRLGCLYFDCTVEPTD